MPLTEGTMDLLQRCRVDPAVAPSSHLFTRQLASENVFPFLSSCLFSLIFLLSLHSLNFFFFAISLHLVFLSLFIVSSKLNHFLCLKCRESSEHPVLRHL